MKPRFAMRSINSTLATFLMLAVVYVGVTHLGGCVSSGGNGSTTRPVVDGMTFDDYCDFAELVVVLWTDADSAQQKKLLADIETAKLVGDSKAIRKIIDGLGGNRQAKARARQVARGTG